MAIFLYSIQAVFNAKAMADRLPTFKSEVQQVEELYHNILPRVSSTPDISSGDSLAGTRPFLSPHRSLC